MIRDRIKSLRRVLPSQLRPSPKNWREHPTGQRQALKGILEEVGYADAVIARECEDGSLELIDGHLRQDDAADDQKIPVLVLDVTEEEAEKLLATIDPLAAMAETNAEKLNDLVDNLDFDAASVRRMVDDLAVPAIEVDGLDGNRSGQMAAPGAVDADKMELQPEEHYDYLLVLADNVNDWNRLCSLLELPEVKLSRTHRRIGMGRGVSARKLLELIDAQES